MTTVLEAPTTPNMYDALDQGEQIARQTVCLEMHVRAPLFRKQLRSTDVVHDGTDTSFIHVSKDLVDQKELRLLRGTDRKFKQWLALRSVPSSMLRGGMYLIPLELIEEVDGRVVGFKAEREQLINDFAGKYDELKRNARERLANHYNEADYPAIREIIDAFTIEARYLSFNVPAALEQINRELYEREKQKVELQWAEAANEIRDALRVGFAELVEGMADRLGDDPVTGKPKVFKESNIVKMREFLETFENRNLTNDNELSDLTRRAKELLAGTSAQALRKNEGLRSSLAQSFAQINSQMEGMVTTRKRKFSFDTDV